MTEPSTSRVAVYLDFDNIVISRYDQVNGRNSFQRDKAKGLESARLARARVDVGAILDFASLKDADLSGSILAGASLAGADFTDANVAKTDFNGADVGSAHLETLKGREAAVNLDKARNLEGAYQK